MNAVKPIDIEGLKHYKSVNPAKFDHKFGQIDLDNIPAGFNIKHYKQMVVGERVRREKMGIPQDMPITPDMFYKKPAEVVQEQTPVVEAPVVSDEPAKEEQAEVVSAPAPEVTPEAQVPQA